MVCVCFFFPSSSINIDSEPIELHAVVLCFCRAFFYAHMIAAVLRGKSSRGKSPPPKRSGTKCSDRHRRNGITTLSGGRFTQHNNHGDRLRDDHVNNKEIRISSNSYRSGEVLLGPASPWLSVSADLAQGVARLRCCLRLYAFAPCWLIWCHLLIRHASVPTRDLVQMRITPREKVGNLVWK